MSSILTNTSSMVALQTLRGVNMNLNKTQNEISTGKSVASASDNSAVWLFEDNSGAFELANTPKMRPRTKHINIKYHHFREFVRRGLITLQPVSTANQLADIFTKPLPRDLFIKFRDQILLWDPKYLRIKSNEGV